jgi:protein gp37
MGVSIEDERVVHRIDSLRQTSALIKFRSLEPLISPLPNLNRQGIDGVITGGRVRPEGMAHAGKLDHGYPGPMLSANVPFFFKQ